MTDSADGKYRIDLSFVPATNRASRQSVPPALVCADESATLEPLEGAGPNIPAPPPPRYIEHGEAKEEAGPQPFSKLAQWERKLLDLGLRNTLINMRLSQSVIPIVSPSLEALEDALFDGGDFSLLACPPEMKLPEGEVNFEALQSSGLPEEFIRSEFKSRRLRAAQSERDLSQTIKTLYRSAKTAAEENGANTLYLALGIIRWYESGRSAKARYAPAILVPVELVRRSASAGYVMRMRDDEPQMNVTLLEKIKQDFQITVGGVDPLPADEHGVDVKKVLAAVRSAIMEQPRWEVLETACVGIFSFSQFVMWNDVRNRAGDLAKNKIVSSLIEGRLTWEARDMQIGERVGEENVLLPLPADASQLFTIKAACAGESFVLHGPPGTGKSQSITALIANALAGGRSVLFVAEKMAALEVVRRRLEKIGIGPFCLELHSNKSRKRDVLEQLRRASEAAKENPPEEYGRAARRCAALRAELDEYAEALHKKQKCGLSVYELINEYEKYSKAAEIPPLPDKFAAEATADALARQDSLVGSLTAAARATGHPHGHPLGAVGRTSYAQQIKDELPQALEKYKSALAATDAACADFAEASTMPAASSLADVEKLAAISDELALWRELPRAWGAAEKIDDYLAGVRGMARHSERAGELRAELSSAWKEGFFDENGRELAAEFKEASSKWFVGKFFGVRQISKKVAHLAKSAPRNEELGKHFERLAEYQSEKSAADALFAELGGGLGKLSDGDKTDWRKISERAEAAAISAAGLRGLCGDDSLRLRCAADEKLFALADAQKSALEKLAAAKAALYSLLDIKEYRGGGWLANQAKLCADIAENAGGIREWITWNAAADDAERCGLAPLLEAYRGGMAHDEIQGAYKKSLYKTLASRAIDAAPPLSSFSGALFDEKIEQFKGLDKELCEAAKKEIFCRLAARVPNFAKEASQSSEVGILQRAIRSGGRGTSIRRLFEQIPNLLPRLCPCMLMSPISAAQYLDPAREPFDLVVFDEASQLPTCKAVGALARGRSAVVVGDPKQMPPTSFFAVNVTDEDNLDCEDLESVLDDCIALGMPQTHLLWHYRSRHESLIAFSNEKFYENRLYTFPSADDRESKVKLVHVDGVFDRGRTRQNRAEAEAVVEELKRRCRDAELSKLSVGIVTFNISQQNLIDDLLNEACKSDAELDAWAYDSEEPVFIKNLENVQGDERDAILFSIGYGPDESGKVHMNFGPLNREGGWRRLNVAITRSRCEMLVFATIEPEQIDLTKSSSAGAAALKDFLEYARGRRPPRSEGASTGGAADKEGVAKAVCAALKDNGIETQLAIGRSGYRVDIGVLDPENEGSYMLGILLDGESYGSSKTTRDREIAQTSVLRGLGWNVMRVWTMDWWDNGGREIKRILAEIERIKQKAKEKGTERGAPEIKAAQPAAEALEKPEPSAAAKAGRTEPEEEEIPRYTATALKERAITPEDFLLPRHTAAIRAKALEVIEHEAPVSEALATRRVVRSFGIARAGSRIQSRMEEIFASLRLKSTMQGNVKIYWNEDQDPDDYRIFRAAASGADRRDALDVPVQEAANAVLRVLEEQVSLPKEELIKEAAKLLGCARQGAAAAALFTAAVEYASAKGRVTQSENGKLTLGNEC